MSSLVERLAEALSVHEPDSPLLKEVPCHACAGMAVGWCWDKLIRCDYCAGTGHGPDLLATRRESGNN